MQVTINNSKKEKTIFLLNLTTKIHLIELLHKSLLNCKQIEFNKILIKSLNAENLKLYLDTDFQNNIIIIENNLYSMGFDVNKANEIIID